MHYGFVEKGKIIKEISSKELQEKYKKKIEIKVNNIKECVKYLEEKNMQYEVMPENVINIYTDISLTDFIVELSKRKCIISEFHEKEESLENYFINLVGGDENV